MTLRRRNFNANASGVGGNKEKETKKQEDQI